MYDNANTPTNEAHFNVSSNTSFGFEEINNGQTHYINVDLYFDQDLRVNNGYSRTNIEYVFNGNVYGECDLTYSGTPTGQRWRFTGDMSEYTGNFTLSGNSTGFRIAFDSNVTGTGSIDMSAGRDDSILLVVGATMNNYSISAKNLSIEVSVLTGAERSVFNAKEINVSQSFTIADGAEVVFNARREDGEYVSSVARTAAKVQMGSNASLTVGQKEGLYLDAGITMGDNSTLSVQGDVYLSADLTAGTTGTLELSETGQLVIANDVHIAAQEGGSLSLSSAGAVVVKSGATLTLEENVKPVGGNTGSLLLETGAEVVAKGQFGVSKLEVLRNSKLTVDGENAQMTVDGAQGITWNGSVVVRDGGSLSIQGDSDIGLSKSVTMTVTGGVLTVDASSLSIAQGANVTLERGSISCVNGGAISLAAKATLRINGGSLDVSSGDLKMEEGSVIEMRLTGSSTCGSIKLAEGVDLTNFKIKLTGDISEGGEYQILDADGYVVENLASYVSIASGVGRAQKIEDMGDNKIRVLEAQGLNLVWQEEVDEWEYDHGAWKVEETGETETFINLDSVTFATEGEHEVKLVGEVTATNVTVSDGAFSFTGDSLVVIGDLEVKGENAGAYFGNDSLTLNTVKVSDGGTLELDADVTEFVSIEVGNDAEVGSDAETGEGDAETGSAAVARLVFAAGDVRGEQGITVKDGGIVTVSTSGVKNFVANPGERGFLVQEGGVVRAENIENWQGYVAGEGTLELSLPGEVRKPTADGTGTELVSVSYDLGNSSVGALLSAAEQIATVKLVDSSFLQITRESQKEKLNSIVNLYVEDGSAFVHRAAGVNIGDKDHTLTLEGSGLITDIVYVDDGHGGANREEELSEGALMLGLYSMEEDSVFVVNHNIVLAADACLYVATNQVGVLGNEEEAGSFTGDGHTLMKMGGGILELGEYFHLNAEDTGSIAVKDGVLRLAYANGDMLATYGVNVGEEGALSLGAAPVVADDEDQDGGAPVPTDSSVTFAIKELAGDGAVTVTDEEGSATLVIRNDETTKVDRNSFRGTLDENVTLVMTGGYQAVATQYSGTTLNIVVSGGTLDLAGTAHDEEDGSLNLVVSGKQGKVTNMTVRGGDVVNLREEGSLLTLVGENTLKLDPGMSSSDVGVFDIGGGDFALADGAVLRVDMSSVLKDIKSNPGETYSYKVANVSVENWGSRLTFGAELTLQNVMLQLESDGSISLSALTVKDDTIYVSTEDNTGRTMVDWDGGDDIYSSTDKYVSIYIDHETHIDLRNENRGDHEDGLVLKNLMSAADADLTVNGDGTGVSMVTFNNNLSRTELDKVGQVIGVKIEDRLTLAGNVNINYADLQIKHKDGDDGSASADSTTLVSGTLTMKGGRLVMTSGVLILAGANNDLGNVGVSFAGNDAQLVVDGTSALIGGDIEVAAEGVTDTTRLEHIKLENMAEVVLKDGANIGAGITLGKLDSPEPTMGGTLTVVERAKISDEAHLRYVLLNLEKGSELTMQGFVAGDDSEPEFAIAPRRMEGIDSGTELPGGEDDEPGEDIPYVPVPHEATWCLSGIVGSGALVTDADEGSVIDIHVAGKDRSFTGDLSNFKGTMVVQASDYTQYFDGVKGGKNWNLTNTEGGRVTINLMGGSAPNSLTMGVLTLESGSVTTMMIDMENMVGKSYINLQGLVIEDNADVTIAQAVGTITLQGLDGKALSMPIGSIEVADGGVLEIGENVNWHIKGIRNASDVFVHVDDRGTLYLDATITSANGYAEHVSDENALAGARMLWAIQNSYVLGGDLAAVDSAVNDLLMNGAWKSPDNVKEASRVMAAAAGASVAVMSDAACADMERQLRSIRNRTTTLSYGDEPNHETSAAWFNAESNYRKQNADGLLAGYKLSGWGGTVGAYTEVGEGNTIGLALTAMYNDLESDGPDSLKGDMDTVYVSTFGQVVHDAWRHTFICSLGTAKLDVDRTVNYGSGSYTTKGSTDGFSFGLMYEVGYTVPLDVECSMCLQPVFNVSWRMNRLKGFTETGSNAALRVEEQTYNAVTFGAGARFQSIVGSNAWNRAGVFESRALLKFDAADRSGQAEVAFQNVGSPSETLKGAERGAVGVEIGAGVSVPVHSGDIFLDCSAELRADYSDVNATVGYKVTF